MRTHLWKIAGVSLAALAALACNPTTDTATTPTTTETAAPAAPAAPDYAAAVAAADRSAEDKERDAARKPAEVLAFSKVMTGQTVLEVEAGTGYYTALLSKVVGPTGKVIMQNPNFGPEFNAQIAKRNEGGRLTNVSSSQTMFDALEPADATVDVVTWFQGPHELYYKPKEAPAGFGDPVKAYAEAFRVLKPGGYFVIMDHAAAAGAPVTAGNDLHRIDPKLVKDAATAAGFTLEEESAILANAADDHTKGVFDDSIRHKTDQFLLRYKKPG